jgi:hypothetical protein
VLASFKTTWSDAPRCAGGGEQSVADGRQHGRRRACLWDGDGPRSGGRGRCPGHNIALNRSGTLLFVANRVADSLTVFRVGEGRQLRSDQVWTSLPSGPRLRGRGHLSSTPPVARSRSWRRPRRGSRSEPIGRCRRYLQGTSISGPRHIEFLGGTPTSGRH